MPRRKRLTGTGIARLRPETSEYTVWDTKVTGLGVRVRPSGSRTFIYHRRTADGVRKMSFGPAALRKVEEVRRACLSVASEAVEADLPGAGSDTLSRRKCRASRCREPGNRNPLPDRTI